MRFHPFEGISYFLCFPSYTFLGLKCILFRYILHGGKLFNQQLGLNHCFVSLLFQAIEILSNSKGSLPIIFLVTDGAVEDERQICDVMKKHLGREDVISPRLYTFGIGNGILFY